MFIKENSSFPPKDWEFWQNKYDEFKTWYSGESSELLKFYASRVINPYSEKSLLWARVEESERENAIHMPVAGDVSSMSSNLLFSETPKITYNKNSSSGEVIDGFIEENGFANVLLEGAELSAALSGCFLKLDMDTRASKLPIVSIITPMSCFPTFLRGRLWEILFYRVVKTAHGGTVVYRLFENRKKNIDGTKLIIEFKLYKGTNDKVGNVIDLNSIEETSTLNLQDTVIDRIDGLGVVYVPNMRPNRLQPGSYLGINDFNACIPLMDSLDLAWTSLIRDIELGMGQIFVDEELLHRDEENIFGTQKSMLNQFSKFQKCFMKLNYSNYRMGGENMRPVEIVQFEMRVDEHLKASENLFKQVISQCGYSPSTFGIESGGRAESGTALRIRERKSFLTREKKSRYWQPAIKALLMQMQQFYNSINTKFNEAESVSVELEDSIIVDSSEMSTTIRNLDQARAISTYIKVKMQHDDWTEEEIEAEVRRIQDEEGIEKNSDIFTTES